MRYLVALVICWATFCLVVPAALIGYGKVKRAVESHLALRKARAIVAESPEARRQRLWLAETDQALAVAAHAADALAKVVPLPGRRIASVPVQRGAVD